MDGKSWGALTGWDMTTVGALTGGATWQFTKYSGTASSTATATTGGAAPVPLNVATSTYGSVIPMSIGVRRLPGNVIWMSAPRGDDATGWFVDVAVSWGYNLDIDPASTLYSNIYANGAKIWNGSNILPGSWSVTLYTGTSTQDPDPTIEAARGTGNTPAYRGQLYGVFQNLPLGPFNNTLPGLSAEIVGAVSSLENTVYTSTGSGVLLSTNGVPSTGFVQRGLTATMNQNLANPSYCLWVYTSISTTPAVYAEFRIDAIVGNLAVGTGRPAGTYGRLGRTSGGGLYQNNAPDQSIGLYADGHVWWNDTIVATLPALNAGDIVSIAHDQVAGTVMFRANGGAWTAPLAFSGPGNIDLSLNLIGDQVTVNFGGTPFVYEAPAGYTTIGGYTTSTTVERIKLVDFIKAVAQKADLDPVNDLTFVNMADIEIDGGIITADTDFGDFIRNLGRAFGFDVIENDTITMKRAVVGATYSTAGAIDPADILAQDDRGVETVIGEPDEPISLKLNYIDRSQQFKYSYQRGRRILYPIRPTESRRQDEFAVPVVITASEALSLAGQAVYREGWANVGQSLSIPAKYLSLEPGDIRSITTVDAQYVVKIINVTLEADMRLTVKALNLLTDETIQLTGDAGTPLAQYSGGYAPVNQTAPTIDNMSPVVGDTLTATPGTWDGKPTPTVSGVWTADGVAITDTGTANPLTLLVTQAMAGKVLRYVETASNDNGSSVKESAATAAVLAPPVNTGIPAITGTASEGQTLTASTGTWTGYPVPTYAYVWKADGVAITGATSSTYALTSAEIGKSITVTVTASNGVGSPASATSNAVGPVVGADSTPDAFTFTDVTNATPSTVYTSNTITVSGINTAAAISITGGTYSVNGGSYTSASGTVHNGDTVAVRVTSSSSGSTAINATLTIGGVSDTYTVTTTATGPTYAGAPGAGTAYRYYQFSLTTTGSIISLGDILFRQTFGGAAEAGVTWTASNSGGGAASNLNDGSNSTFWGTSNAISSATLTADLGAAKLIKEIMVGPRSGSPGQGPTAITIKGSNDGTNFTTLVTATGLTWPTASHIRYFGLANPSSGNPPYWRVKGTANQSGGSPVNLAEIQFRTTLGGANAATGGAVLEFNALSTGATFGGAFDGSSTTFDGSNTLPVYLGYAIPSGADIRQIALTARNDASYTQAPASGAIEYSYDGVTWTQHVAFSGLTWTQGSTNLVNR